MTESVGPACVLIVDDNVQNLELLEAYLEAPDLVTQRATSGQEALAQVARQKPDVILLDVMMPRMSGFEVCKQLKGDRATSDIPVIMVTALAELSDKERGVECGADDFLSKPVPRQELLDRIRRALAERNRRKAAAAVRNRAPRSEPRP